MPPVPPGIREIDPDAEAARLAEARKRIDGAVLVDEFHQAGDLLDVLVHIRVTAAESRPVPADLGRKLAGVIRENWPAS